MQVDKQTFEDELLAHGSFVYRNVGVSMRPLIKQGRDLVVIGRKPEGRLSKYDVVLFKQNGRYILHRVVKVRRKGYVTRGDNCLRKDRAITDDDVVGIMTEVVRKGKPISTESAGYQRFAKAWCALFPLRAGARVGRTLVGRAVRKYRGAHTANCEARRVLRDAAKEAKGARD